MIRSMTAFARKQQQSDWGEIIWELRSVNHRYLEITVRLPDSLRALEVETREWISKHLGRGKLEGHLKFQPDANTVTPLSLNHPLAQRLLAVTAELEHMMGPGTGLKPIDVLCWPGVVEEPELNLEPMKEAILDCLRQTLVELVETREQEGKRTADMILQRCEAMDQWVRVVRKRRPQVVARIREKMLSRLTELPVEADSGRLEQEMAIIAQRLDVEEELDRLDAHLAEIRAVLQRSEPVGRRLDFLMQELNREANTLSSKSADTETTQAAVELKVLIEQMREQVQNIE